MTEAAATRTLVMEREMAHPPEKIWRALTEGHLMEAWLMQNDFQPVVGHAFSFRAPAAPGWDGIIASEVLVVEPVTRLAYRWGALGLESIVTWTLTPTESGTHVRMEHSGFPMDKSSDVYYHGARYGWQKFMGNLAGVVERMG